MSELTQLEVVNKVIMYSFNFEYKFLNLVFDSHLANHFEAKWYDHTTNNIMTRKGLLCNSIPQ